MNSRTKSFLIWISSTLFIAALVHLAAVWALPYGIIFGAKRAMANRSNDKGIVFSDRPAPADRSFRHLARNLIYSAASFDVSKSALHIEAPITDSYMSVTLYAADGEAFHTMNDHQIEGDILNLILVGSENTQTYMSTSGKIISPTSTGIIMLRYLVKDDNHLTQVKSKQTQLKLRYENGQSLY
jgi:uncharacterized membrane protein